MLENQLYQEAIRSGLPAALASLVTAQAKHESANFTSRVFKANNNLFGYKFVGQKNATRGSRSPEGDHYAKYATPEDSIRELVAWLRRRERSGVFPLLTTISTPEQYASLLKKAGYYGDSEKNYTAGLKRYFKNYGAVSVVGILVFAGLLYLALSRN